MGCVQQAVLEFDEEIPAPWRPRLVAEPAAGGDAPVQARRPHPSRRSPSRVGVCRPPELPARPSAARPSGTVSAPRVGPPWRELPGPARRRPVQRRRPAPVAPGRLRMTRRARRLVVVLALAGGVGVAAVTSSLLGARLRRAAPGRARAVSSSSPVTRCGRSRPRWAATATCGARSTRSSGSTVSSRPTWCPDRSFCCRDQGGRVPARPRPGRALRPLSRPTSRQETHNVAPGLRQPSVRARSHCVVAPTLTVVRCQAPWRTEQRYSPVNPRPSRSIRPEPGGRANCSDGGTMPTAPARCGCGSSSAVSRRRRGPT